MKTALLTLLFFSLVGLASAQLPFTYETNAVLTSSGDFAPADSRRDVAVVDRASGQITLGIQQTDGSFVWTTPEPSGVLNVTSLAVDRFNAGTADVVAVTSPMANRAVLAAKSATANQLVVRSIFPVNPSPQSIAPFDPNNDTQPDLLIVGDRRDGSSVPYYYEMMVGVQSTTSALWQAQFNRETYRLYRFVQKTGTAPLIAEMYGSTFVLEGAGPTGLTLGRPLVGAGIGPDSLMTYGNFDGSVYGQVILYVPGDTVARSAKTTEISGTFGWSAVTSMTFPKAVKQLSTIPLATGARIGVLFQDTTAAVYDYNGTTLTLRNSLPGNGHDWLNPIGNDAVLSKNASGWQRWDSSQMGGVLTPVHSGSFPTLGGAVRRVSNVVFLSGESFVSPEAIPLGQGSVRDWSAMVTGSGTSWNVTAASFTGNGIGVPSVTSYQSSVMATHAMPNQYRANISISSLETSAGATVPDVIISPPSGVFRPLTANDSPVPITFSTTTLGHQVRYRVNAGAWLTYNPANPPGISSASTFQAYAVGGGSQSPIRSANYSFAAAPALTTGSSVDQNGNGIPDEWEKSFNITNPHGDDDLDGVSNFEEYQAGTDPRDASAFPAPLNLELTATLVGAAPARMLRLEWQSSLGNVILESSATLQSGSWTPITTGISSVGSNQRYEVPIRDAGAKRFYRLRLP